MQCPRCYNSEISVKANYCKICGLNLKKTDLEARVQSQPIELKLEISNRNACNLVKEYNHKRHINGSV